MKIELKSISLTYPGRTTVDSVLRDVNAEFGSGEFALVIGPSGSGKTSLLLLLGGLLGPTGGLILLDGESCGHWSRNERRLYRLRRVGFIFQSFRLIEALDVAHNVAMPLMIQGVGDRDALRLAIDTLESLGLDAKAGAPIRELSGGERQRVAIARALITDPAILLGDEPTASLDAENGRMVAQIFRDIAIERNKVVIAVTHDVRMREFAHRVVELVDGRVLPK